MRRFKAAFDMVMVCDSVGRFNGRSVFGRTR
jgi:hypothetical protein